MKKNILFALFAFSLLTLNSCIKLTKCNCMSGQSLSVNGADADAIRANCESQSGGTCTY